MNMNTTLNEEETAALLETRDFLRELAESTTDADLRIRAKAHAAVVNMVVQLKGNYPS